MANVANLPLYLYNGGQGRAYTIDFIGDSGETGMLSVFRRKGNHYLRR